MAIWKAKKEKGKKEGKGGGREGSREGRKEGEKTRNKYDSVDTRLFFFLLYFSFLQLLMIPVGTG